MASDLDTVGGRARVTESSPAAPITVVGRQAIRDRQGRVVAHELLFRTPGATAANVTDGDSATAEVLVSAITDIGLDELVGNRKAFVNVPHRFLVDGLCRILPPERVVLEILEDVPVNDEVVAAVAQLVDLGYTIALDDFEFRPELEPLVDLAHIIKIDVLALSEQELATTLERLDLGRPTGRPDGGAAGRATGRGNLRLLAEKVEDRAQLPALTKAGFELFQGYGLDRPETVQGGQRTATLQVLSDLYRPDVQIAEAVDTISHDPSLAYALLRIVNSAATNRGTRISSLRQAVVMLGLDALRNWATLLLMTRVSAGSTEAVAPALVRAKLCERLAETWGTSGAVGFTLGMLSSLPNILGEPLSAIVDRLSLEADVEQALLDHSGPLGRILACAEAYERGDSTTLSALDAPASLPDAALAGLVWARQITETAGQADNDTENSRSGQPTTR